MTPTIGRVVHYEFSAADAELVRDQHRLLTYGSAASLNMPAAGETYPAMVVRAHPDGTVNLQVLLDGVATYWATSRRQATSGDTAGRWFWPPRV
jgi:hypothetical protein